MASTGDDVCCCTTLEGSCGQIVVLEPSNVTIWYNCNMAMGAIELGEVLWWYNPAVALSAHLSGRPEHQLHSLGSNLLTIILLSP